MLCDGIGDADQRLFWLKHKAALFLAIVVVPIPIGTFVAAGIPLILVVAAVSVIEAGVVGVARLVIPSTALFVATAHCFLPPREPPRSSWPAAVSRSKYSTGVKPCPIL